MSIFKSLWYLGGLDSIDPRISANEAAFGQTYGSRVVARKAFPPLGNTRAFKARASAGESGDTGARPASACG